jgi:hypothetical protein
VLGGQACPDRDAEIVPAMRAAALALALLLGCGACGRPDPAPPDPAPGAGSTDGPPPGAPGDGAGGTGAGGEDPRATIAFERLDASGDCAGVVPEGREGTAPVAIAWTPPDGAACEGGFTDGTGHVAVSARPPGATTTAWRFHARDGAALGEARDAAELVPAPDGFHALRRTAGPGPDTPVLEQVAFGPDGAERRATTVSGDPATETSFGWAFAADPAGGSAVAFDSVNLGGNHWYTLRATRFDAEGGPRAEPARVAAEPGPAPIFLGTGVSGHGDQLLLRQQSAFVGAAWLDGAGAQVASATWDAGDRTEVVLGDGAYQPHALALSPLLDGGLAVRVDGTYRRAYPARAGRSAPLPAWLAERAGATYRFTRGNAGYAVFRPGAGTSGGDCARRIELVSPSGRLCGRAVLPAPEGACTPGAIDQGWDGSVVEQLAPGACAWRVWPRLLAP